MKIFRLGTPISESKAYVFGPLHLFGEDYLPFYKAVVGLCRRYFDRVIGTWPDFWQTAEESPPAFYKRTFETISGCKMVLGEVSSPSTGVGMELKMAADSNIPFIAVAKAGVAVSKMVLGLPNLIEVVRYETLADLMPKLDETILNIKTKG